MKMSHKIRKLLLVKLSAFLIIWANTSYSQAPTITVNSAINHNNCGNTNSVISYTILLSNGWTKFSTVTSCNLYFENVINQTSDLVYNHLSSYPNTTNIGVVNNLGPGHYYFSGVINTKGTDGIFYNVSFTQHIWIGYNTSWELYNDMFIGSTTNSLFRNASTAGLTYSYGQSYNTSNSNYGFIQLKKTTTAANSTIYCVLTPNLNLSSFTPSGNYTYLEFKTVSSVTTVKLKYFNGSVYTTYTLPVSSSDLIRINRSTSNTLSLSTNNNNSAITGAPTFVLSGNLKAVIYGVELNSEAIQAVTSFPCAAEAESTRGFAKLKRELDGGYESTLQGKLRFFFEEEYKTPAGKFIPLRIYDMDHQLKAEVTMSGSLMYSADQSMKLPYDFDDNRKILPLNNCGCLSNGNYYLLEVETSSKEKKYLKFQYNN